MWCGNRNGWIGFIRADRFQHGFMFHWTLYQKIFKGIFCDVWTFKSRFKLSLPEMSEKTGIESYTLIRHHSVTFIDTITIPGTTMPVCQLPRQDFSLVSSNGFRDSHSKIEIIMVGVLLKTRFL